MGLSCFKAYDIRGKVPEQLSAGLAYDIALAFAAEIHPTKVVVGYDIRLESPEIAASVRQGLLEDLPVVDLLLDGARADQPVDGHGLRLPQPPGPLARLRVRLRVPVRVVQDDAIRADERQADAARARRQEHDEGPGRRVERVRRRLARRRQRCDRRGDEKLEAAHRCTRGWLA